MFNAPTQLKGTLWPKIPVFEWQPIRRVSSDHWLVPWCEALFRPGHLTPAALLRHAERTGELVALELALMSAVIHQAPGDALTSVNLSTATLNAPELVQTVSRALYGSRITFPQLCFEITEHAPQAIDELGFQHALLFAEEGARIAVDDAGCGSPAETLLDRSFVTVLKLDRCVLQDPARAQAPAIARWCERARHSEGLALVCEGIESESDLGIAQSLGATHGQGFYLDARKVAYESVG